MSEKLSERLEALAVEAGYEGLPDDQNTLREAAAVLRAVEGAPVTRVEGMPGTANGFGLMVTSAALVGRRVALVPLDAAGSAEGVGGG